MPVVAGSSRHALSPPPPPPRAAAAAAGAAAPETEAREAAAPPPPPPPPRHGVAAWQPSSSLEHAQHDPLRHPLGCSLDAWSALWAVVALTVSLVCVRRLVAARRWRQQQKQQQKEKRPSRFQPPHQRNWSAAAAGWKAPQPRPHPPPAVREEDNGALPAFQQQHLFQQKQQFHYREQQLRALQQQQGLYCSMAAAPCHEATCASRSAPPSPSSPLASPMASSSRERLLPPPPPLTAPALAASIFRLDAVDGDGGEATAMPAAAPFVAVASGLAGPETGCDNDDGGDAATMDPQLAFMHQPNPDYLSVDMADEEGGTTTIPVAAAILPMAAASPTTAVASGHRSASGSPRLRNYAKVLPIRGSPVGPGQAQAPAQAAAQQPLAQPLMQPQDQLPPPPPPAGADPSTADRAIGVRGEIIAVLDDAGAGWTRHTRVYGGGVCLACLEAEANGGDDGGAYGENVPLAERRRRH